MENDTITFVETNVCDGSAWSLKWGTLILYPVGLVFSYNRPRKDNPGRMQDVIRITDIKGVSVESMDWLVSKIFWVGRMMVVVKTLEGEKQYYLRNTANLLAALNFLRPSIKLTDKTKS